jgi:adenosine deaminase
VQTHATPSLEQHPLPEYLRRGLNVVLNTDNRLMSGVSLTDEYLVASRELGLDFEELSQMAINGFESAFLPFAERRVQAERARQRIGELRGSNG